MELLTLYVLMLILYIHTGSEKKKKKKMLKNVLYGVLTKQVDLIHLCQSRF